MRILQVINSFGNQSGGAERLALRLHLDLLDAGVDATLLAVEACETQGVPQAKSLGCRSGYHPGTLPRLVAELRRHQGAMDLVHGHLFPTSALLSAAKRLGAVPAPLHFTEHSTHNRRRETRWGRAIDRAIYRSFSRIHCISGATRNSLIQHYPQLADRCDVITNGAVLRFGTPPSRGAGSPVKLLSLGSLRPLKNHAATIAAVAELPPGLCDLTILGDGPDRAQLDRLAGESATPVRLLGHVPDPTEYLKSADAFVIPSQWEGFGLAAVEAMNAALPVVSSDVPGLKEVVGTDGSCSILVAPDDIDGLRDAIAKLCADPALRARMGRAGFERAKQFDRIRMTQEYVASYRAAIEDAA